MLYAAKHTKFGLQFLCKILAIKEASPFSRIPLRGKPWRNPMKCPSAGIADSQACFLYGYKFGWSVFRTGCHNPHLQSDDATNRLVQNQCPPIRVKSLYPLLGTEELSEATGKPLLPKRNHPKNERTQTMPTQSPLVRPKVRQMKNSNRSIIHNRQNAGLLLLFCHGLNKSSNGCPHTKSYNAKWRKL